jgi:hypothetical protein
MKTLNNQQQSYNPWQNQVTKLAVTDFNHPSFNLVQSTSAKEDIASVTTDISVSNNELIIENEPELSVILGYAEFGYDLEIYGNL